MMIIFMILWILAWVILHFITMKSAEICMGIETGGDTYIDNHVTRYWRNDLNIFGKITCFIPLLLIIFMAVIIWSIYYLYQSCTNGFIKNIFNKTMKKIPQQVKDEEEINMNEKKELFTFNIEEDGKVIFMINEKYRFEIQDDIMLDHLDKLFTGTGVGSIRSRDIMIVNPFMGRKREDDYICISIATTEDFEILNIPVDDIPDFSDFSALISWHTDDMDYVINNYDSIIHGMNNHSIKFIYNGEYYEPKCAVGKPVITNEMRINKCIFDMPGNFKVCTKCRNLASSQFKVEILE